MSTASGASLPGGRQVRPTLVLAICCMSLLVVAMDATIVNVALPAIRSDLHASISGLQWVIDAYTMVVASLYLLSGSLADRFGRRRVFQLGMLGFTVASVLCSVAPGLNALVAFRVLQAAGASMLNPVAMSIVTNTFVDPKARARAIGVWGAMFGIAMALGPLVGGSLTQLIGWRSIFWINAPIGAITIAMAQLFVPESRAPRARRFDPVGQLLVLVALFALVYAIIEGPEHGWRSPLIIGLFAGSALAVLGLVVYEPRRHEPLLDLRFFRSLPFSSATVIAVCMFGAFAGFLFLNALYLQVTREQSALIAGVTTMPLALATVTCAPLSGRLVSRYGTRPSLVIAGLAIFVSAVMLTSLEPATPLPWLLAAYALFGIGFGLANPPITNTAVSGMPRTQAGVAAAIASTSRQIGTSLGVALAGTIVGAASRSAARQLASGAQFASATHAFWWLAAGAGLVVSALGVASTGATARASVGRIAALLEDAPAPAADAKVRANT